MAKAKFKAEGNTLVKAGSCERLTVIVKSSPGRTHQITVVARNTKYGDLVAGQMRLEVAAGEYEVYRATPRPMIVTEVEVDRDFQRCGIGTRLYEKAVQLAKTEKATLVSDMHRSKCSDAFWQKQVAKGRAACVKKMRKRTDSDDRYPWATGECGRPIEGRGGCVYYALKSGAKSLAGRRGR